MERLDRAADMIGASRPYLVSKTRKTAGDEVRASCDVDTMIERLQHACESE